MYSINLAAYVMAETNLPCEICKDENSDSYYMLFPQCAGVAIAVKHYKINNPSIRLHDFLKAIREIRDGITAAKEGSDTLERGQ